MSSTLFDGRRQVEGRHCRELARILSKYFYRWNEFRGALGIPVSDVKNLSDQIKQDAAVFGETAFYSLIHLWISKSQKNATFGALMDVLARQLQFIDAANEIMEREWT